MITLTLARGASFFIDDFFVSAYLIEYQFCQVDMIAKDKFDQWIDRSEREGAAFKYLFNVFRGMDYV